MWTALLDAVEDAGLHQAEVSILDKGQRSQKGYKARRGELVPFYDLVMSFDSTRQRVARLSGAGDIAVAAVVEHLRSLPDTSSPKRHLDYLYSLAVGAVIEGGARPTGLSLRSFEELCKDRFERAGEDFYL